MIANTRPTYRQFQRLIKISIALSVIVIMYGVVLLGAYFSIREKKGNKEAACVIYLVCAPSTTTFDPYNG